MLLPELALRHLLGGRFAHFFRHRWSRWLSAFLSLVLTAAAAVYLGLQGSPVWGVSAFFGVGIAMLFVRKLLHRPLPEYATGAYASAVTFVAVSGIALAVMTLIVVVSVMDGFSRDIQTALLKTTPEVMVTDFNEELDPAIIDRIRKVPGVVHANPYVENNVLLKLDGFQRPIPVLLRGAEREHFQRPSAPTLLDGSWDALDSPAAIFLGSELAKQNLLGSGDEVWLLSPDGTITPMGVVPAMDRFTVAGIFATGFYEVDQGMVITGLATAQTFAGLGDRISGIDVGGLEDPFDAPELAERIQRELGMPLLVLSWAETRRNLYEAMQTEKVAMFIIESLLILIASFNVSSTLFMAISRKTREIGLLLSLGVSRLWIAGLFSLEGFLIGAAGALSGAALGTGFALYLKFFPVRMPGGGSVYYIDTVPVHISWGLIGIAVAAALVLSLVASLYPALRAARLAPAKALRFE